MQKLLRIAWKDLFITFTDRNLLLIMLVTPLLVSTIIGSAFSGFVNSTGNDVPIQDIPLVIYNGDQAVEVQGSSSHYGQTFLDLLVPADPNVPDPEDNALLRLTDAVQVESAEAARAGVDDGTYNVAIIIPADFTRTLVYTQDNRDIRATPLEVYASGNAPTSASIVRAIAENISYRFLTGSVTIAATIEELLAQAQADPVFGIQFGTLSASGRFQPNFEPAFRPEGDAITLQQQTVTGEVQTLNPLVVFGAAQALFFMLFTANGGALSILEERRDGTLQRMITSPTPRMMILFGKLVGTFVTCVFQVVLLFLFLTIIGSILAGQPQFIWGNNPLLVFVVVLTASFAAAGLGTLIASLVRTPEQGNIITSVISIFFGVLGGAFFNVQAIPGISQLSRITLNYWASDAFTQLALGQSNIGINLLVLMAMGGVFFVVGVLVFSRRLSI
jgi:ABC-2 type transport system permease protein